MDFIKKYFIEYEYAFFDRLDTVGMKKQSVGPFLDTTAYAISQTIRKSKLEKIIEILLSDNPAEILFLLDTDEMSADLEMTSDDVSAALAAISPVMKQIFILKNYEIVSATASLAWEVSDDSTVSFNDKSA